MGDALGEVMKQVIFSQFVQFPPLPLVPDLSDPAKFNGSSSPTFDLTNTTNLYISSPKGNYLPCLQRIKLKSRQNYNKAFMYCAIYSLGDNLCNFAFSSFLC